MDAGSLDVAGRPLIRFAMFRTWLQLFRAPNLFTVPGDPLAGYLFANSGFNSWDLLLPIFASLCFYSAGLLMNDLADVAEDRRDRPDRPLPSGAATVGQVRLAMWLLNAAGLGALLGTGRPAALLAGGALVAAVWLYNRVTKPWPVVGALNMGVCRGLSVMLGANCGELATAQLGMLAAIAIGLYVAAVTNLARHETRPRVPVTARLLPSVALVFGNLGGVMNAVWAPAKFPSLAILLLALVMVLAFAWRLFRQPPPPLPPIIGAHIRLLLPLQAALSYMAAPWDLGPPCAAVLLAFWPLSARVARRFYAS
jgi:4-hydroxybenzoate polyprenyltransferase